ncbi:Flowering time control protein like [Actinidia chinensis var. chinensis]|uniref:Flowering time control protein like n=1 Tax=Actinidia chinensis var. chinensis TaxID=1590841 RepID=A0A2R6R933_ACTCC|nr:Flowering time control protein like [Actinidia chinensis var. chinensis]
MIKEKLEEEFLKFGKIEDFRFLKKRNAAYVDYMRQDDDSQALKIMNANRIGGDQICVDFLRSNTSKREQRTDYRDERERQVFSQSVDPLDSRLIPQDVVRNNSHAHSGYRRQEHPQSSGMQKTDGQPSNILWIGYPPSVHIDEQMMHNAMILFGEIDKIKSFPSRNFSFVEFRSVDEARRAKEGLQGRLFNDPRILIRYSSSELGPCKDYPVFLPEIKGPRTDVFFNEPPFQSAHMDMFNHNLPMVSNARFGPELSNRTIEPNVPLRPFGPQGTFGSQLTGPDGNNLTMHNRVPDANLDSQTGDPNWKRSSPAPGMRPSPLLTMNQLMKPRSSGWDVSDANLLHKKWSRIDDVLPVNDSAISVKKIDNWGLGLDQLYGHGNGGVPGPLQPGQKNNWFSPEVRIPIGGTGQGHQDHDYMWRGVIARGGTPICRARCVPIGKGIESEMPVVINCSARTDLDMLTKHYAVAIRVNVVFFFPDSEEDFASYTEFLHYLGVKHRAGVAKFDDGTILFFVPPSDFLSKVLNVSGPARLYGVALKFPQLAPGSTSMQPLSQSHYMNQD